jgi:selenocysteine lyase/cysteine desulfurase
MTVANPIVDTSLRTRRDFSIAEQWAFLDNSFVGPLPEPVRRAVIAYLDQRASVPTDVYALLASVERCRDSFARLIGAHSDEIGFLYTTSEAENVVVNALELKPGDNIVTTDLAYSTTTVLGKHLEKTHGIELRVVPHVLGGVGISNVEPYVDRRTRLITVPWVSHISGFRHPVRALAALAHSVGALIYVDAIQIVGTEPIDVKSEGIDFLSCGTFKWLMSGWGVSAFYVRQDLLQSTRPDRFGWQTAHATPLGGLDYQERPNARKFEFASPAFDQFPGLEVGLSYLEEIGLDAIAAHSDRLIGDLRRGLTERGFEIFTPVDARSPCLAFWVGTDKVTSERHFAEARVKIGVATGDRVSQAYGARDDGSHSRIRLSPAHYNNSEDISRFISAVEGLPRYRMA